MTTSHSPALLRHTRLTSLMLAIVATACGNGGGGGGDNGEVVVFVPAGAAPDGFTATVQVVNSSDFPATGDLLSPVFAIGPSGTQFDLPVTIGIPIPSTVAEGTALEILRLDEGTGTITALDVDVVGGVALARTEHFSQFVLSQADQQSCHNIATDASQLLPLNSGGEPTMQPGTLLGKQTAGSAAGLFSMGSTWAPGDCTVTVSGSFGPGLDGDGEMIVRGETVTTVRVPHMADGTFSIQVDVGEGLVRSLEFSDPCVAANENHSAQYILEIGSWDDVDLESCVSSDLCANVSCGATQWCDPLSGSCEDAIAGQGECELHPNSGTCGSSSVGKCVQGYCVMEIIMDASTNGQQVCVAEGLVCDAYPLFMPPPAACLAFHPNAAVTSSASNWSRQSVHCESDNTGLACAGRTNTCHDCPACTLKTGPSGCGQLGGDIFEHIYVNCIPAP